MVSWAQVSISLLSPLVGSSISALRGVARFGVDLLISRRYGVFTVISIPGLRFGCLQYRKNTNRVTRLTLSFLLQAEKENADPLGKNKKTTTKVGKRTQPWRYDTMVVLTLRLQHNTNNTPQPNESSKGQADLVGTKHSTTSI